MSELKNYEDYYIKEIIDGHIYYMTPGISAHVWAINEISDKFKDYFKLKNIHCKVFSEGLEVYLNTNDNKNCVVPDISIICDESKFGRRGYKGVPELIVEVISPKTARKDKGEKFKAYEKAGVTEYWIVDPKSKLIDQYVLVDGKYDHKNTAILMDEVELDDLSDDERENYTPAIKSSIFNDLEINLNDIFLKKNFID